MRVRSIDSNHDWNFGKGYNDYAVGANAIAQNLNTRVNSFLGDCFFDLQSGIDWFHLAGDKDTTALNLAVTAVILNTQDIVALLQLTLNLVHSSRVFNISYQVQTIYSVMPIPGGTAVNLGTVS